MSQLSALIRNVKIPSGMTCIRLIRNQCICFVQLGVMHTIGAESTILKCISNIKQMLTLLTNIMNHQFPNMKIKSGRLPLKQNL